MSISKWAKFLSVGIVVAVYGCSSTPSVNTEKGNGTTITGSFIKESSFVWQLFYIHKIDGQYVSYPAFTNNKTAYEIGVPEGRRDILVEGTYIKGFSTGTKSAYLRILAELKPETKYIVQGKVLDNGDVDAWVEEVETGKHVSATVNAIANSQSAPIPIFIPRR